MAGVCAAPSARSIERARCQPGDRIFLGVLAPSSLRYSGFPAIADPILALGRRRVRDGHHFYVGARQRGRRRFRRHPHPHNGEPVG